jgi:hypothetical protein
VAVPSKIVEKIRKAIAERGSHSVGVTLSLMARALRVEGQLLLGSESPICGLTWSVLESMGEH